MELTLIFNGDYRQWYAGTGGNVCNWILFPPKVGYGYTDDSYNTYVDYEWGPNWIHSNPSCTPSWFRAYNCTESWTTSLNDYYLLTFTGSSITRIFAANNRGVANIYIDGVYIESYGDSITSPPRWQVARTYTVSPTGDHTILVYYRQAGGNPSLDLDAFAVDIPAVGTGTYDDGDTTHITYFANSPGDWTHSTGWPQPYLGTVSWNNTAQDGLRFTFNGNYVTYYYDKAYNRGWAGIVIDGYDRGVIDEYSSTIQWDFPATFPVSGPGPHTIEITVMGQHTQGSTDYLIDLDKFVVSN